MIREGYLSSYLDGKRRISSYLDDNKIAHNIFIFRILVFWSGFDYYVVYFLCLSAAIYFNSICVKNDRFTSVSNPFTKQSAGKLSA